MNKSKQSSVSCHRSRQFNTRIKGLGETQSGSCKHNPGHQTQVWHWSFSLEPNLYLAPVYSHLKSRNGCENQCRQLSMQINAKHETDRLKLEQNYFDHKVHKTPVWDQCAIFVPVTHKEVSALNGCMENEIFAVYLRDHRSQVGNLACEQMPCTNRENIWMWKSTLYAHKPMRTQS